MFILYYFAVCISSVIFPNSIDCIELGISFMVYHVALFIVLINHLIDFYLKVNSVISQILKNQD